MSVRRRATPGDQCWRGKAIAIRRAKHQRSPRRASAALSTNPLEGRAAGRVVREAPLATLRPFPHGPQRTSRQNTGAGTTSASTKASAAYYFIILNVPLFARAKPWPTVDHAEIVRRSRILVVDDDDFPYGVLFEGDGYTIRQWTDVESLTELENGTFDIILLDLRGVGRQQSASEGLGLLEHIRATSPAQIVIAYSNSEFSLDDQPFFRNADAVLHKSRSDYAAFKRTVDRLLDREVFS